MYVQGKGKGHPLLQGYAGCNSFSTSALEEALPQKCPVLLVQEAGWASGPVWSGKVFLAATGTLSSVRPDRSKLLYRMSYTGNHVCIEALF
jgi:hypothetical protein